MSRGLISDYVGKRLPEFAVGPDYTRPHPHTSVGIEVEVEGMPHNRIDSKRWRISYDEGSLQNGIEFISEPVWGTAITDALDELNVYFTNDPPYISFRTSVHVHVNVLDLTPSQLARLIKLYVIYEPAMFRLHENWSRHENIFCVPVRKSIAIQKAYASIIKDMKRHKFQVEYYLNSKYAAMNPLNLRRLGTFEFRHMGGTADTQKISEWINVLLQLKTAAILEEPLDQPREVWGEVIGMLDIRKEDVEEGINIIKKFRTWR